MFEPACGQAIVIDGIEYRFSEHPSARGMPYGQEGRTATVYQLSSPHETKALKVFLPRFRVPSLVMQAEQMASFGIFPGLQVCRRTVLTPSHHVKLLREFPDLTYSVLMNWIQGQTWMEIVQGKQTLSPDESLSIARTFTQILVGMEERGLAHCDLSAANIIIQFQNSEKDPEIALIDVEGLYSPGLLMPEALPSGSAGYAHKTADKGLWSRQADRFAGAVLIGEILGWSSPKLRQAAWGESYFDPKEMQTSCDRFRQIESSLRDIWSVELSALLTRAWNSDSLADCPTFGEWLVAMPEKVPDLISPKVLVVQKEEANVPSISTVAQGLIAAAQQLEQQDQNEAALATLRQALILCQKGGEMELEIAALIRKLEKQRPQPAGSRGNNIPPTAVKLSELSESRSRVWSAPLSENEAPVRPPASHFEPRHDNPRLEENKNSRRYWAFGAGLLGLLIILALAGVFNPPPMATPTAAATPTGVPQATAEPAKIIAPTSIDSPPQCISIGQTWTSPMDGMILVCVPAGEFLMGMGNANFPEVLEHNVLLDAYWIDKTEVTNEQFQRFSLSSGYLTDAEKSGSSKVFDGKAWTQISGASWKQPKGQDSNLSGQVNRPVIHVSWNDAQAYCMWASRKLPTEAQWEKAARGTDALLYPWGNTAPKANMLNFNDNIGSTTEVGAYPQGTSPYGALDMAGNVWEWVMDWYSTNYYASSPTANPSGPSSGTYRVSRGGSWHYGAEFVRSGYRLENYPYNSSSDYGFRCSR